MPCLQPFRDDSAQLLLYKIAGCLAESGGAGVTSFNGLTGVVTFTSADIITLLGFTPISQADGDSRYVLKSGDTMTGALSIGNGTLVASAPVLSLSQTWNNAAVAFTGFLYNVTDTASASNSNYFNFQSGGSDRLTFTNAGQFTIVRHGLTNSGVGLNLRKRGNSVSADGAVANSSVIANIVHSGWDGTAFQTGGMIQAVVEGDWSGANRGMSYQFQVTPTGSTANLIAFNINGGVAGITFSISHRQPIVAKVADYTITNLDHTINCTAGTFTVTLPTSVGITGRIHVIKNSGVGTITLDGNGAQTIDSLATQPIVSGASITVQSDGANWIII